MEAKITPYADSLLSEKQQVTAMFNNVASRYDFLNHFLSAGIDVLWRRKVINLLKEKQPEFILDMATGTADLAIAAARLKPKQIIGVDLSAEMLAIGKKKVANRNLSGLIQLMEGDSENLLLESNKFDAVTVGFGVRNFEHLDIGLKEIYRVMKKDGTFIILEFSRPKLFPVKQLYDFYFKRICPLIGKMISKDTSAYTYLYESVKAFPEGKQVLMRLEEAGFRETKWMPLTFGIASVYIAVK